MNEVSYEATGIKPRDLVVHLVEMNTYRTLDHRDGDIMAHQVHPPHSASSPDPDGRHAANNLSIPIAGALPQGYAAQVNATRRTASAPPTILPTPTMQDLERQPQRVLCKAALWLEYITASYDALDLEATAQEISLATRRASLALNAMVAIDIGNANSIVPWLGNPDVFIDCPCGVLISSETVHECTYALGN